MSQYIARKKELVEQEHVVSFITVVCVLEITKIMSNSLELEIFLNHFKKFEFEFITDFLKIV